MRIVKERYAYRETDPEPRNPILEKSTFMVCGTESIALKDPRGFTVDGQKCVLISISCPFYKVVNPGHPEDGDTYFNSPFWRPYQNPLLEGLVLIENHSEYKEMKTAFEAHMKEIRKNYDNKRFSL